MDVKFKERDRHQPEMRIQDSVGARVDEGWEGEPLWSPDAGERSRWTTGDHQGKAGGQKGPHPYGG